MSRENIYNAIILKKQPYGEGDEILTMFTEEAGKMRALAKSVKFSKSKLQHSLQTCFKIKATLAGRGLPKIIGAETINVFPNIREDLKAAKMAFFALEAMLKGTPDEQKNEHLYFTLSEFFTFLDLCKLHQSLLEAGLAKFKIEFLNSLGFSINVPERLDLDALSIGFSPSRGSFISGEDAPDFIGIKPEVINQFLALRELSFSQLISRASPEKALNQPLSGLNDLLSHFILHQLERELRSETYLN